MLIGARLGILDIIFMLALVSFACWKGGWIRVLLSVCIVIWGAYAIPYDIKVAAPMLGVGTVLFFMEIMKVWKSRQERQDEKE
jgi:hypothetical protein